MGGMGGGGCVWKKIRGESISWKISQTHQERTCALTRKTPFRELSLEEKLEVNDKGRVYRARKSKHKCTHKEKMLAALFYWLCFYSIEKKTVARPIVPPLSVG